MFSILLLLRLIQPLASGILSVPMHSLLVVLYIAYSIKSLYSSHRMDYFPQFSPIHHTNELLTSQYLRALHTYLIISDSREIQIGWSWVMPHVSNRISRWSLCNFQIASGKEISYKTELNLFVLDIHFDKFKRLSHY